MRSLPTFPPFAKGSPMSKPKPQDTDWGKSQGPDTQAPDDAHPTGSDGSEINPGTKPEAGKPTPPHNNPDAVEHAMIKGAGPAEAEGGRDESQVAAPTVSLYPTSQPQGDADAEIGEHRIFDKASLKLNSTTIHEQAWQKLNYPFEDMDVGQGMFIPVEQNGTTDKLMSKVFKQVDQFRKQNSETVKDEVGDEVMENIAVNQKMRNEDGTVKLDGDKPRLTIGKSGFFPKLIGPTFAVKAVVKGDEIGEGQEAEADGALVIRLG